MTSSGPQSITCCGAPPEREMVITETAQRNLVSESVSPMIPRPPGKALLYLALRFEVPL